MSIEGINNLPSGWEWSTLGEICEKSQYGWTTKADHSNGSLKLLRTTDITSGEINWDTVPYCTESPDDVEKYLVKSGDVLISRAGSVGVSFLINNPEYAVFASYLIRFRPRAVVNTKYFYYFLKSPDYWAAIGESKAGIAVPNVNASKLSEVQIPLAPLAQQNRIIAEIEKQFSRLDEAVANLKRVKANLKRYKAAVLKAAVEGKLTEEWRKQHPDVEPADKLLERILAERRKAAAKGRYKEPVAPDTSGLPELPAGWVWASWDQVGLSKNGRPFPSAEYCDSGVKLLRPGNLHESGKLVWTDGNTRYMPTRYAEENQDLILGGRELVMNLTAQSLKDEFLGRVCLTSVGEYSLLNQRLARLSPIEVTPEFSLIVFKSKWFRRFVDGLNTGSLIQHMFTSQLARFAFPLPPLAEHQQIVTEVERHISIVAGAEAQVDANLRRADRLRQSILKQAFSGLLVLQDPNDEPASVLLERTRATQPTQAKQPTASQRKRRTPAQKKVSTSPNPLPLVAETTATYGDAITARILVAMQPGREYARADLADPLGLSTGQWNAAIQELKRVGKVRQVGEKRGARYLRRNH